MTFFVQTFEAAGGSRHWTYPLFSYSTTHRVHDGRRKKHLSKKLQAEAHLFKVQPTHGPPCVFLWPSQANQIREQFVSLLALFPPPHSLSSLSPDSPERLSRPQRREGQKREYRLGGWGGRPRLSRISSGSALEN